MHKSATIWNGIPEFFYEPRLSLSHPTIDTNIMILFSTSVISQAYAIHVCPRHEMGSKDSVQ
jgi:hypothetical protein